MLLLVFMVFMVFITRVVVGWSGGVTIVDDSILVSASIASIETKFILYFVADVGDSRFIEFTFE